MALVSRAFAQLARLPSQIGGFVKQAFFLMIVMIVVLIAIYAGQCLSNDVPLHGSTRISLGPDSTISIY